MAKFTIGFEDYEEPTWEEYTGPDPKVGTWHTAALKKVQHKSDDEALLFIFEIDEGDFQGWGRGVFAPYAGERKWKAQQVLRAVQGGQTKAVTLDWDNEKAVETWAKKQKRVKIKIGEYNERVNIDKVAPLLEAVGKGTPAKVADTEDADGGDFEDYTEEELAAMEISELEEILKEDFEVESQDMPKRPRRGGDAAYKDKLIEAVLDEQERGDEDSPETDGTAVDPDPGDEEFDDGFEDEPEPEPEPAPRTRRTRTAAAAPAKAAPASRRRR
jgi:hypothetical protein